MLRHDLLYYRGCLMTILAVLARVAAASQVRYFDLVLEASPGGTVEVSCPGALGGGGSRVLPQRARTASVAGRL